MDDQIDDKQQKNTPEYSFNESGMRFVSHTQCIQEYPGFIIKTIYDP